MSSVGVPAATAVPPGQYPPLATVSQTEHSAWILIATALGLAITILSLLARVIIRKFINPPWHLDDTWIVVSTVIDFIQSALVMAASSSGLGNSIDSISPRELPRILQLYYASNILYVLASDLSKASVVLFVRQLLPRGSIGRKFNTALLIAVPVSTLAFLPATALQCDLTQPWNIAGQCPGWFVRWEIQGIVASLIEVAIFFTPVYLTWSLQAKASLKLEVISPFALRLLILIFTGFRLSSFNQSKFASNPTLYEAQYICWTQAELSYSIMAATIPTARKLVLNFITYYNGGGFGNTVANSQSGTRDPSQSYQMKSFKKGSSAQPHSMLGSGHYRATAKAQDRADGIMRDSDSQEMIIKKEVTVDLDYASRP
ncbi:hypothetical protein LTR37_014355 [Vermiconidia calcicola]|uniref:Uncharacterized protein n=1 Tax=Vermiconidia calcicola TaxID=1690605 RepID=A0ACC3MV55_9PEZI|nr:hypothetical protein LTR37_014355 [Vermiconidia calcicola]